MFCCIIALLLALSKGLFLFLFPLSPSLSVHLAFHIDSLFRVRPKSRRRTMRRRNAENSRGELSSRRLVSSQRYLSLERTAGCGTLILYRLPIISFSRFPSSLHLRRSLRFSPHVAIRGAKKKIERIANRENHEIASSAASQRQIRLMLKKPLFAHYRL